ncbi:AT-hook motif nuclear-localized protein 9-like [Andrographis paniculata]|uniref:AT-hook motif nuclear-localized protein 9-like n=1 Tax=Andrographis paniculata TaxID=175694 RepID=UPI0021E84F93|nr:AT-hook motif nuclear-localized protein 9-like [Andrographis paniculata]
MARTKTTPRERTVAPARNLRPIPSGSIKEHILTLNKGEDIFRKVMNASTTEPGVIFVKAISGTMSLATICHFAHGEYTIYEGLHEIIEGTFVPFKDGTLSGRMGTMNATSFCPDGNIINGRVKVPVIAATPLRLALLKDGLGFL